MTDVQNISITATETVAQPKPHTVYVVQGTSCLRTRLGFLSRLDHHMCSAVYSPWPRGRPGGDGDYSRSARPPYALGSTAKEHP
jgi:hypothetical protein